MPELFRATGLVKLYGSTVALAGVDVEVGESEIVGLLGPNGAGKSTLVKIACGLVGPTSGSVQVCGAAAGSNTARSSLGYLAELFRFQPWLQAGEVLQLHQRLARSTGGAEERDELLALVGLTEAAGKRVDAMSKGMQQRLGIAQALVGSPRLLMLDEPTSALDPAGRRAVRVILEQIRDRGISVFLNSHLLGEVEYVCDRVIILLAGEVIAQGAPGDLAGVRGVLIETGRGTREFPDASRDHIPRLVEQLIAEGESIYSVKLSRPTLEDVYLEAVKGVTG